MAGQDRTPRPQQPLAHTRILITRSPERSLPLIAALERAGAEALLLPLIDFERATDQHSLDVACDALGAGAFDWLVVSSATTVHVLRDKAAERGLTLGRWIPPSTRVAAVGPASRSLLAGEGVSVALTPEDSQSASGLLAVWPRDACRVFLPQADIAAPRLAEGLKAADASVTVVTAYRTVDYPADEEHRLSIEPLDAEPFDAEPLDAEPVDAEMPEGKSPDAPRPEGAGRSPAPPSYRLLTPAGARAEMAAGRLDAVVAASPSAVRRIDSVLSPLNRCRLITIGRSTAETAARLGLDVAEVAAEPTPGGLVAAIAKALESRQDPDPM
ncbi:MAG TPA: uroporphyrinogen-III synthase [Arthrobacter sp.]|jgi:uroporphyrinogen-III synthase